MVLFTPYAAVFRRCRIQKVFVISGALLFCTVITAFFAPLGAAVAPIFSRTTSLPSIKMLLTAARFTFIQAALSAAFASIIGLCAAFFCARRAFLGRRFLLSLSAIPLSVPPVVIALAFILCFGKNGFVNRLLLALSAGKVSTGTFLYSTGGVLLVHTFYNFPIAMRTIAVAWEQLPEETEQAAGLLGASPFRIFRTVIFPELKAPFFAAFVIIFLYCFFSFVIILLLGGIGITTLEVELYQTLRRDVHAASAGWIAAIETGIAATAVLLYTCLRRKTPNHIETMQYTRPRLHIGGIKERVFFAVLLGIIFLCLLLPLFSLFTYSLSVLKSGQETSLTVSFHVWRSLLQRPAFWIAVRQTVQVGVGTAALSVITALFFSYLTFDFKHTWYKSIPFIPFAVSSIILGSGWLKLEIVPSLTLLIIVQTSLAWPFAWTQIEISLAKIPRPVIDAAHLLSACRRDEFFRTLLPLCKPGIAAAFCSVFAISAGDASLPLLLHLPNFENLALMLFRFAGAYRFLESSSIAVILAVLTGFLFFIQDVLRGLYEYRY